MENKSNKFFDGLLWGAVLGGAVVFFMGTEKGRKLFKTIREEGLAGLHELGDLVQDYTDIESDDLAGDVEPEVVVRKSTKKKKPAVVTQRDETPINVQEESVDSTESSGEASEPMEEMTIDDAEGELVAQEGEPESKPANPRRFFKGIHRKN